LNENAYNYLILLGVNLKKGASVQVLYNKIPLRDAVKGLIPNQVRQRPKKGLNMPYQKWFKQKGWEKILHDCLQEKSSTRKEFKGIGVF